MSDANRLTLAYQIEASYGSPLGGGSAVKEFKHARESFAPQLSTARSMTVRSDRMTDDIIRVQLQPAGSVETELAYTTHNDFMLGALCAASYSGAAVESITATFSISASTITRSSGTWDADIAAGRWIYVSGASNAANNGYHQILVVTSTTVIKVNSTLANEGPTASVSLSQFREIINSTSRVSYSIEKGFADLSSEYELVTGAMVNEWNLTIPTSGIMTQSFGFMGQDISSATATMGSGTTTAAPTSAPIPAVTGVAAFKEAGAAFTLTGFTARITNNLRPHLNIGNLGPADYGMGSFNVGGTIEAYYASKAAVDKVINTSTLTPTSLLLVVADPSGNKMLYHWGAVKFTSAERIGGGRDTDIVMRLGWEAYRNAALEGSTVYDGAMMRFGWLAAP